MQQGFRGSLVCSMLGLVALSGCHFMPEPPPAVVNIEGAQTVKIGDRLDMILPADRCFSHASYKLTSQCQTTLSNIAALLKKYPKQPVLITGHSDHIQPEQQRNKLARQRAASVAGYLFSSRALAQRHIYVRGVGSEKPISTNNTAVGYAFNRRVVISLFLNPTIRVKQQLEGLMLPKKVAVHSD